MIKEVRKRKNAGGKSFSILEEIRVTSGATLEVRCHFETNVGQTDWHFSNEHELGLVDPPCPNADDPDFPFANNNVTVISRTSGRRSYLTYTIPR